MLKECCTKLINMKHVVCGMPQLKRKCCLKKSFNCYAQEQLKQHSHMQTGKTDALSHFCCRQCAQTVDYRHGIAAACNLHQYAVRQTKHSTRCGNKQPIAPQHTADGPGRRCYCVPHCMQPCGILCAINLKCTCARACQAGKVPLS